jgi:hypothetical protein
MNCISNSVRGIIGKKTLSILITLKIKVLIIIIINNIAPFSIYDEHTHKQQWIIIKQLIKGDQDQFFRSALLLQ